MFKSHVYPGKITFEQGSNSNKLQLAKSEPRIVLTSPSRSVVNVSAYFFKPVLVMV